MIVDSDVRLVDEWGSERPGGVGALDDGPPGEVPRRAEVAGGAVDVDRARGVRRAREPEAAALDLLTREVRIALGVPRDRRITPDLPVLALDVEGRAPREVHRDGRVVPVPPLVEAVLRVAVRVAAPVVVGGRDEVVRLQRVRGDRGLVLRLPAALEVRVCQVEAVLVHLDVRREVLRAGVATAREVARRPTAALVGAPTERHRGKAAE